LSVSGGKAILFAKFWLVHWLVRLGNVYGFSVGFFSNIFCLAELVGKQHFRNYNIRNNHLVLVSKWSCTFHIRKNIGKRLSALFLLSYVRSLGK